MKAWTAAAVPSATAWGSPLATAALAGAGSPLGSLMGAAGENSVGAGSDASCVDPASGAAAAGEVPSAGDAIAG
jgi:hypothetical protein